MRDDLTPVLWLARGLILAFLTTLALSQFGLYALCRALRDGTVPPAVESESAVRPVLALSGRRSAESA